MINLNDPLNLCSCMKDEVKHKDHPVPVTKDRERCLYCGSYVLKKRAGEKEVKAFNDEEFKPRLKAAKWSRLIFFLKEINTKEKEEEVLQ